MTNHSYKGLTQPLQTDTAKPRPAKRRVPVSPLLLLLLLLLSVTQLLLEQRQVVYQCDCSLNEYKMLAALLMLPQIYQTNTQRYLYSNLFEGVLN